MSAPYLVIAVCLLYRLPPADSAPDGGAQCKKPNISTIDNIESLYKDKEYYEKGEEVTPRCSHGFYPSYNKMTCDNPDTPQEWTPPTVTCIGFTVTDWRVTSTRISAQISCTTHCPWNWEFSVRCCAVPYDGRPCKWSYGKHVTFTNLRPSTEYEIITELYIGWKSYDVRIESIRTLEPAQCKKPDINNIERLSIDKEYYKKGEKVTVRCNPGYYPSSDTMTCDNPDTPQEWTPPTVTCIGVTMTDWRVTSTNIRARISCTHCPWHWMFEAYCCAEPRNYRSCKRSLGQNVIFTDLRPFSVYEIITRMYTDQSVHIVKREYIRTLDSVSDQPGIVTVPSMEDNTIRWGVSDNWGEITGFQMNISARRDYNASFAVDESMEFPPNVTEYKIPLQYGTNYTITLRGFTSAGAGEDTTENIETPIGDPLPPHMEMTSDGSLHFHPVLDLNGPIGSYEVIVFADLEGNLIEECVKFKNTPYNSSGTPSHYTAAVLPAETLTAPRAFILGDDQHYNGFHNAPLNRNNSYSIYVRVTSRWKHVEKSSCAFAGIIRGVTRKRTSGFFIVLFDIFEHIWKKVIGYETR